MNSNEYLDAFKTAKNIESDNQAANALGITRFQISKIRHDKRQLQPLEALIIAEELELEPGRVLADLQAEKEHAKPVKQAWEIIAKKLKAASVGTILLLAANGDHRGEEKKIFNDLHDIHYTKLRQIMTWIQKLTKLLSFDISPRGSQTAKS